MLDTVDDNIYSTEFMVELLNKRSLVIWFWYNQFDVKPSEDLLWMKFMQVPDETVSLLRGEAKVQFFTIYMQFLYLHIHYMDTNMQLFHTVIFIA